jgi:hypothetical protein
MDAGTLDSLARGYGETRFPFSRVGAAGRRLELNGHTAPVFGRLRLKRLDSPHIAADRTVCLSGPSRWACAGSRLRQIASGFCFLVSRTRVKSTFNGGCSFERCHQGVAAVQGHHERASGHYSRDDCRAYHLFTIRTSGLPVTPLLGSLVPGVPSGCPRAWVYSLTI